MNHIELFAGCGGLSLGLASVGFDLLMANEWSPMAAETFAYNFLNEDLTQPDLVSKVHWISSQYSRGDLSKRLREDPRTYPKEGGFGDMPDNPEDLGGSLVVGDIWQLNAWLKSHPEMAKALSHGLGNGSVDLVSGGPPCQSFSMAGLREKNNAKNTLPWAFAEFVSLVKPKITLLENVTGILRPFTENGKKYHAWFEVCKVFAMKGYVPIPLHVNAKFAGVAQNRPRFIMLAVRRDLVDGLAPKLNDTEAALFKEPLRFYEKASKGEETAIDDLPIRDLNKEGGADFHWFEGTFLSPLLKKKQKFVSVKEAIDDLKINEPSRPSAFVKELNKTFAKVLPKRAISNNEKRANVPRVARRFRIYQVLSHLDNASRKAVVAVISGQASDFSDSIWEELKDFKFLKEDESLGTFKTKVEFLAFLQDHQTKKLVQKALVADVPAPAALSIPDDCCHYDDKEIRTLSVREMARIQSFPDSFMLRSKVTTGGTSRQFEVPQYTQVGNAVPPLLGRALGEVVAELLKKIG